MSKLSPRGHAPEDGQTAEERVVERHYGPAGNIEWERAGIRRTSPPALAPAPDGDEPIWFQALVWTLGGFWHGLELVGQAVLAVLAVIGGLVLGVLAIAFALAAMACVIGAGYWAGAWIGGPSGAIVGTWIAVAVVLLTLIGALGRRGS